MKRLLAFLFLGLFAFAQPPVPRQVTAKEAAPEDITGWWVSVVTEDWRWRMMMPAKGDFTSVPVNAEGRKVTGEWDPAKDEAAGNQCKAYGAAGLMRLPTRLHITWSDDSTLKVETDEGTQTRLFHFAGKMPAAQAASWQGYSSASWDVSIPTNMGFEPPRQTAGLPGSLKVVTANLKPGYLRKNGVPYGANTVLTEYFTRVNEAGGDSWLLLTSIAEDPQYLTTGFLTSDHFKREADGAKWSPSACAAR